MSIPELKSKRSILKGQLTRKRNTLNRIISEDDLPLVREKYNELKLQFKDFESAHNSLQTCLTDEAEMITSEEYFAQVQNEYTSTMDHARLYLKDRSSSPTDSRNVSSNHSYAPLPKAPTPDVFSGIPETYPLWSTAFSTLIDKLNISTQEKMLYLKEYTSGEARSAIEALFLVPSETSYSNAMSILKDRFGNTSIIVSAFRKKLENWPRIEEKDHKALQAFSDFLIQLELMTNSYPALKILDDEFENKKLLSKLPRSLVNSWIERVVASNSFPLFKVFCAFVKEKTRIATHHLKIDLYEQELPLKSNSRGKASLTSFVTNVDSQPFVPVTRPVPTRQIPTSVKSNCPLCTLCHSLDTCPTFTSMSSSERRDFLLQTKLCFGCFSHEHWKKDCQATVSCDICHRTNHPTLLHDPEWASQFSVEHISHTNITQICNSVPNRPTTMILPVQVSHKGSQRKLITYALLDTQSDTNFISEEVKNLLDPPSHQTVIQLKTLSGKNNFTSSLVHDLVIQGLEESAEISLPPCYTRSEIPCDRDSIPDNTSVENLPHLSKVRLPPLMKDIPVGLLIGYHTIEAFRPLEILTDEQKNTPFGWKTPLGWCVMGGQIPNPQSSESSEISHCVNGTIALCNSFSELKLDSEQINNPVKKQSCLGDSYSQEDVQFIEIMENQMSQEEDLHYKAPLPLKGTVNLPNNKFIAERRLRSLANKFERDPEYFSQYSKFMSEMIKEGYAEIVSPESVPPPGRTWYIPHHSVYQGKLRIVFDCSVKLNGFSLNDNLLQGPDLLNSLIGIVLRFRLGSVALTCDIQKMYHQFRVPERDRDLLRFLWWKDNDLNFPPSDHRMCVHLFGATSSPGVATFGLRKIADDYSHKHSPESVSFVKENFYVDDGVTSVSTCAEAIHLVSETKQLLARGALKCHKFMSNKEIVVQSISEEEVAPTDENGNMKTLGIMWNVSSDSLHFPLSVESTESTRRNILSILAKFYDPLGIISPLFLKVKVLLQQSWKEDLGWDDPLTENLQNLFLSWRNEMNLLGKITIPRQITTPCFNQNNCEIHHFSDASEFGYAACSYLRYSDDEGNWYTGFLLGKSKVVPSKPMLSIPRLELTAAVLSTRLAQQVRKELPFACSEYFWSDSTIVLSYIKNANTRFKTFVANRIQAILDGSEPEMWHHVNGTDNPADCGSRGILSSEWLQGPKFLLEGPVIFHDFNPIPQEEFDVEIKAQTKDLPNSASLNSHCLASSTVDSSNGESNCVSGVLPLRKNWLSTLKVYAWVLRFIKCCRNSPQKGDLTVDELEQARLKLLSMSQKHSFKEELKLLESRKPLPRSNPLFKLDTFIDQSGLLRVGGRLRHSTLDPELKHPVLLSAKSEVSKMLIQHCHDKTHHQGRGITCNEIRSQGVWIIGMLKTVKKMIHNCVLCSRLRKFPCEQKMADLPTDRSTPTPPFTFCGCDVFGPFSVKHGRSHHKRYGVIFTCLMCRAVHIEVVHSLTTDSFINAFKRFTALRGPVRQLRCDQGTNFIGAKEQLLNLKCDMIFNPPSASHRGGIYERMIGSARRVIEGILIEHPSQLDDEGLLTIMAETSLVINSRPLCTQHINDPLAQEPLTPNHLLTMKSKIIPKLPESLEFSQTQLYSKLQWKRIQFLVDLFWSRWKKEIIHLLQSRSKWNASRPNLKPDDIVLVVDEQKHRSFWKMARILKVKVSSDNLVRTVELQLANRSTLERPIQKVIHLLSS